jgi:hypothetical protein
MQIYISRDGQQNGPYGIEDVNAYLENGTLLPTDLACQDGMTEWVPLSQIPGVVTPEISEAVSMSPSRPKGKTSSHMIKYGWAYFIFVPALVIFCIVFATEYMREQQGKAWIELESSAVYRPGDTIRGKAKLHAKKPFTSERVTARIVFMKESDAGSVADSNIVTVRNEVFRKILFTKKIKFNKNDVKELPFELTLPALDIVGIEDMENGDYDPRWVLCIETETNLTFDMTTGIQIQISP